MLWCRDNPARARVTPGVPFVDIGGLEERNRTAGHRGRNGVTDLLAGRVLATAGAVQGDRSAAGTCRRRRTARGSDRLMAAKGTGAGLFDGPQEETFAGDRMRVNVAVADLAGRFWGTTMSCDALPGIGALHRFGVVHRPQRTDDPERPGVLPDGRLWCTSPTAPVASSTASRSTARVSSAHAASSCTRSAASRTA